MRAFDAIVLGAGPAGTGPLVAAARDGVHGHWLGRGVLWADAGPHMGPGRLPRYAIDSDTMARVLLEGLAGEANPLAPLAAEPIARELEELGDRPAPLARMGHFYRRLGEHLQRLVARSRASAFLPRHRAVCVTRRADGTFAVTFAGGRVERARTVVLAMGGHHDRAGILAAELAPGVSCARVARERLAFTDDLFARGGLERVAARLRGLGRPPQIVVAGGSHSALCAAALLLGAGLELEPGGITLLCRRTPRLFYASAEAARRDGYGEFTVDDVCPATGRVFRLAGVRMAGRELLQRVLGVGGRPPEDRVSVCPLPVQSPAAVRALLDGADLVVPAFGYRPTVVPMLDARGRAVSLAAGTPDAPLVDARCRLRDADGDVVPGAYAIGLASGYVPRGAWQGGEPSFRGQTNGLWLYQHDVGRLLLGELMS